MTILVIWSVFNGYVQDYFILISKLKVPGFKRFNEALGIFIQFYIPLLSSFFFPPIFSVFVFFPFLRMLNVRDYHKSYISISVNWRQ